MEGLVRRRCGIAYGRPALLDPGTGLDTDLEWSVIRMMSDITSYMVVFPRARRASPPPPVSESEDYHPGMGSHMNSPTMQGGSNPREETNAYRLLGSNNPYRPRVGSSLSDPRVGDDTYGPQEDYNMYDPRGGSIAHRLLGSNNPFRPREGSNLFDPRVGNNTYGPQEDYTTYNPRVGDVLYVDSNRSQSTTPGMGHTIGRAANGPSAIPGTGDPHEHYGDPPSYSGLSSPYDRSSPPSYSGSGSLDALRHGQLIDMSDEGIPSPRPSPSVSPAPSLTSRTLIESEGHPPSLGSNPSHLSNNYLGPPIPYSVASSDPTHLSYNYRGPIPPSIVASQSGSERGQEDIHHTWTYSLSWSWSWPVADSQPLPEA